MFTTDITKYRVMLFKGLKACPLFIPCKYVIFMNKINLYNYITDRLVQEVNFNDYKILQILINRAFKEVNEVPRQSTSSTLTI